MLDEHRVWCGEHGLRTGTSGSLRDISQHHDHAIHALGLYPNFIFAREIRVATLHGCARSNRASDQQAQVPRDVVGPHLAQRCADELVWLVGDAEVSTAEVTDDDAVTPHDQCQIGQGLQDDGVDLAHGISFS